MFRSSPKNLVKFYVLEFRSVSHDSVDDLKPSNKIDFGKPVRYNRKSARVS